MPTVTSLHGKGATGITRVSAQEASGPLELSVTLQLPGKR